VEIFKDAFKNLSRRSLRSILAILGVASGVFSFLILGAMAEHFRQLAYQFNSVFENRVFVVEKPTFWAGGGILSIEKFNRLSGIEEIEDSIPVLISRLRTSEMIVVGLPRVIVGVPPEKLDLVAGNFALLNGDKNLSEINSAVLGYDVARELDVKPGDKFDIEDEELTVAGVYRKTGGLIDSQIYVSLSDAQRIYHREGLITGIFVIPQKDANPEHLALSISNSVSGVSVIPPSKFKEQVRSSLSLWNSLTLGAALIACFAGALCIIIVMLVSVSERVVEIGIKKAIGAETSRIIGEFLGESVLVSAAGWITGSGAALLFAEFAGKLLISGGVILFDFTGRLFAAAFIGTIFLGVTAGLYPAFAASRIKPVEALKVRY
jgi:putative ABC transport system permease protein